MSIIDSLKSRADNKCELCGSGQNLNTFVLAPKPEAVESAVLVCDVCKNGIASDHNIDPNHWRCLNDSMWSEHIPVQVLSWRILDSLKEEEWAQDLKTQMYFDDETVEWASALSKGINLSMKATLDSNGASLADGDSVTLIKDLVVKGANFTAKRGTLVKNISLTNDTKYIEGRVNGTHIVLVAAFLKKA